MTTKPVLDIQGVLKHLPHRPPFLLIDRVLEFEPAKSIVAIKNVTINEPFFVGHFPQQPVMPGVLILEALAQASAVLAFLSTGKDPSNHIIYFAGIDNARFKKVVQPGDQLRLEIRVSKIRKTVWKVEGVATVDGEVVCTADLMSAEKGEEE